MMLKFYGIAVVFVLCMPFCVHASVLISEVAWMGSTENANAEWIELYNNGPEQDISGWTLEAVDGQPSITLTGSIGANAYALLERSGDTTVQGVPAFQIYTGAMGNDGEVLELRDANGVIVDQVDGSNGWKIGGSNTTKETLQRQGEPAIGAWGTAPATPQGSTSVTPQTEVDNTDDTTLRSTRTGGSVIDATVATQEKSEHLEPALVLRIGSAEQTVTVGVQTHFEAHAFKENGKEILTTDVVWNFGDGAVQTGRKVDHMFTYTGDYVVSVTASRTGYFGDITDTVRKIVHVVEPSVSISDAKNAYIALENKGNDMIDLSGAVLVSGGVHFRIPDGTLVLPHARVTFGSKVTGLRAAGEVHLFDTDGAQLSTYGVQVPQKVAQVTNSAPRTVQALEPEVAEAVNEITSLNTLKEELLPTANAFEGSGVVQENKGNLLWWISGLILSIGIAVLIAILLRREREEIIEGFLIESEE